MSLPKPYYETDLGRLYHGDCLEILPHLEPVDLVLTDPPYGVSLGDHADSREVRKGVGLKKQGYISYEDTKENFIKKVVPAIELVIPKSTRSIVFCAGINMWDLPRPDVVSAVYLPAGQGRTKWGFQNLAHFLLYGKAPNLNLGAKNIVLRSTSRADDNGHPCPKPLGWILWLLDFGSIVGETVLDPFLGSGTTAVACERLKRRWVGIEIEEKYCAIAAKRIETERRQLKLF
jgi:site-specific DNA-methyltransferase (adenine-specific)